MGIQGDLASIIESFLGAGTITDTENDFYSPSPLKNTIYRSKTEKEDKTVSLDIEKHQRDDDEEGSLYVSIDHLNDTKMTPFLTEHDQDDHLLSTTKVDKKVPKNDHHDNISSSIAVNMNNNTVTSSSPMSPLSQGSYNIKPLPQLPLSPQSLSPQSPSPQTVSSSSPISPSEHHHRKHRHRHHHYPPTELSSVVGTDMDDQATGMNDEVHRHHHKSKVRSSNILSDDQSQSDSTHDGHRRRHHHSKDRAHRHHQRHHHSSKKNPTQSSEKGGEINSSKSQEKNRRHHSSNIPESMSILKEDLNRYSYSKYDFPPSPSTVSSIPSSVSSMKTETPLIKRF